MQKKKLGNPEGSKENGKKLLEEVGSGRGSHLPNHVPSTSRKWNIQMQTSGPEFLSISFATHILYIHQTNLKFNVVILGHVAL